MTVKEQDALQAAMRARGEALSAIAQVKESLDGVAGDLERASQALQGAPPDSSAVEGLAQRFGVAEDVLVEFARTVGELLEGRPLSVDAARRAGLLAAAGQVWENELGPLLTSAQVRDLLGNVSRQRVDELLRTRRLIGLRDQSGRWRFPAFQFRDGRPLPELVSAFWTLAAESVSDWTAAAWCVAPDEALAGLSPRQWVSQDRDPERLAQVARQDAARLAR
jgi:hypothetical protein